MMAFNTYSGTLLCWLIYILTSYVTCGSVNECTCGTVFLTVSSLWTTNYTEDGKELIERELEMNWDNAGCNQGFVPQLIALYDKEPDSDNYQDLENPLVQIFPVDYPDGFYKTNISLGRPKYPGGWNGEDGEIPLEGDHCYQYWIVSFHNDTVVNKECLKIRPTWIGDFRTNLSSAYLTSLFLPGTHNSGSYYSTEFYERFSSMYRYLLAQDTDVWGQLVHGIRYLDLRIGYYLKANTSNADHRFYINHDMIRIRLLLPVLKDIRKYLMSTKSEIIILDLHRFPWGFGDRKSRHRKLVKLLNRELGQFAFPRTGSISDVTLGQMWDENKRLIITYGHRETAKEYNWLWPPMAQLWGDQRSTVGLYSYLNMTMDDESDKDRLWAAMAELTPSSFSVLFGSGSLRQMADKVNRNVTNWFCREWWNMSNIVATDFFLGNNIIDVSIRSNLAKFSET